MILDFLPIALSGNIFRWTLSILIAFCWMCMCVEINKASSYFAQFSCCLAESDFLDHLEFTRAVIPPHGNLHKANQVKSDKIKAPLPSEAI